MRVIWGIYFWVCIILLTIFLFLVVFARQFFVVIGVSSRDGMFVHDVACKWGSLLIRFMPGWKVTLEGLENIPVGVQSMVIVANHESMSDIWAMYCLGIQFRWLSKESIFKIPLVGHAMRWAGYVPVNRKSRESGSEAMRQSARILARGIPMFFFPEGTRSVDGVIKKFKIGAFKLAQDAKAPVLPIAIHGAGDLFRKGSIFPSPAAHIKLRLLAPVPPPQPGENLDGYADVVRQLIVDAHRQISQIE